MNALGRSAFPFIVAVLAAALIASVFSTQFVVAGLLDIGIDISSSERIGMTMSDLAILQTLGLAVTACFLIGFLIAGAGARLIGGARAWWFVAAGASSIIVMLLIMSAALSIMPIAGARTTAGMIFQGIAGAIGGWIFAKLSNTTANRRQ